jgi:hypothetical protein
MNPVKSISYSKYSLFNQCPKKFQYIYIEKLKEAPSEILERGNALHKEMEEFILYPTVPIPPCAEKFKDYLTPIRDKLVPEEFWNAGEDFKPLISYHPDIRFVGKVDAYCFLGDHMVLIDWKTGKVRDKQMDQLELYAVLAFNKFPDIMSIATDMVYLDYECVVSHTFKREELPRLEALWKARIKPFVNALEFPANVTPLCGWCSFSSRHFGGPCADG